MLCLTRAALAAWAKIWLELATSFDGNAVSHVCAMGLTAHGCAEREAKAASMKPTDHQALFSGNTDDHFRLGIKQTRYSSHYSEHANISP